MNVRQLSGLDPLSFTGLATNTRRYTTNASSPDLCIHAFTLTGLPVATRPSFTHLCRLIRQTVSSAGTTASPGSKRSGVTFDQQATQQSNCWACRYAKRLYDRNSLLHHGIRSAASQWQWRSRKVYKSRARGFQGEHIPLHPKPDRYADSTTSLPISRQLTEGLAGYSRVVLALTSLYYMPLHPRTCTLLYSVSCLLDALDGYAARRYEQSTKFGAVLDMVTDRCTTTCLLVFLAQAFPRWSIVFQLLISLDLASHYMHMYATLSMGGSSRSHKNVDESRNWLLKQYYSNNVRLTCANAQHFTC